jgi:hypothetical protein
MLHRSGTLAAQLQRKALGTAVDRGERTQRHRQYVALASVAVFFVDRARMRLKKNDV